MPARTRPPVPIDLDPEDKEYLSNLLASAQPEAYGKGLTLLSSGKLIGPFADDGEVWGMVNGAFDYKFLLNLYEHKERCNCWESKPCQHVLALAASLLELELDASQPTGRDPNAAPDTLVVGFLEVQDYIFFRRVEEGDDYELTPGNIRRLSPEFQKYMVHASEREDLFDIDLARIYEEDEQLFSRICFESISGATPVCLGVLDVELELVPIPEDCFVLVPVVQYNGERARLSSGTDYVSENVFVGAGRSNKQSNKQNFFLMKWPDTAAYRDSVYNAYELDEIFSRRFAMEKLGVTGLECIPEVFTAGPGLQIALDPDPDRENLSIKGQVQLVYGKTKGDIKAGKGLAQATVGRVVCFPPTSLRTGDAEESYVPGAEGTAALRVQRKEFMLLYKLEDLRLKYKQKTGEFDLGPRKIRSFLRDVLPVLLQRKIPVRIHPDLLGVVESKFKAEFHVEKSSGQDWFKGALKITGLSGPERKAVLEALRAKRDFVRLKSGVWVDLTQLELAEITRRLENLGLTLRADGTVAKISRGALAALELDRNIQIRAEQHLGDFHTRLKGFAGRKKRIQPSSHFAGTLRDYQNVGLNFLNNLYNLGTGGVLGDDMGLGKTIQSLCFLDYLFHSRKGCSPFLIVAPVSALSVWKTEAARFCPSLPVSVRHGSGRQSENLPERGLVLTSYGVLVRDLEQLKQIKFAVILADEAQNVKNHRAQAAQGLRELKTNTIICLSGTPLENHLTEFWSIMDLGFPGLLGTRASFRRTFTTDENSLGELKKRIAPFFLRRRKSDVLKDLPPITETSVPVPMTSRQTTLYEQARRQAVRELEKAGNDYLIKLLPHLMRLRRIACHPELEKSNETAPELSGKFAYLGEKLGDLDEAASGVLIFSQFTDVLAVTARLLEEKGFEYFQLDGQTPAKKREKQIEAFQAGERKFFLISLKAGGTALTLHRADTVLHLDPWWNPATERQATDRVHRIGQERPVLVYRLYSEGTVEEKVLAIQAEKRKLFDALFGESMGAAKIGRKELRALLE